MDVYSYIETFDNIRGYFTNTYHSDRAVVSGDIEGCVAKTKKNWHSFFVKCIVDNDTEAVYTYVYPQIVCGESYRHKLLVYMSRFNAEIDRGAFSLDEETGEVSFCIKTLVDSTPLSKRDIGNLVDSAIRTSDEFFERLDKLAHDTYYPEEDPYVIEKIVNSSKSEASNRRGEMIKRLFSSRDDEPRRHSFYDDDDDDFDFDAELDKILSEKTDSDMDESDSNMDESDSNMDESDSDRDTSPEAEKTDENVDTPTSSDSIDFDKLLAELFGDTNESEESEASADSDDADEGDDDLDNADESVVELEDGPRFNVILTGAGDNPERVIDKLASLGFSNDEAKRLVKNAPSLLYVSASESDARIAKDSLCYSGADIELEADC